MNLRSNHPKLTEAGVAFLKCAFASPDFAVDPGKGIPDQFNGRTLAIKDCATTALNFSPGTDTYIIVAPIPGYQYFIKSVITGTDPMSTTSAPFQGVTFPTFNTNFGDGNIVGIDKYSAFRYASSAVGLYPTSNMMQFSGSVQVWRTDLHLARASNIVSATNDILELGITGMQSITVAAPRDNYSESFIKGMYTYAFDNSQDFEFSEFTSASRYTTAPAAPLNPAGNSLVQAAGQRLTGLGNLNTIIIKVTTPLDAVNTAMLRVWNCLELQPNTNSALFQFSGVSPPHDPLALELYHSMKMRFPVAIPCADNGRFWETVLKLIQQITAVGSLIPGPIGLVSGASHNLANVLAELSL